MSASVRKRKILIITAIFPPFAGASIQRIIKLTKYLPDFDWQPIILTVKAKNYWLFDSELENSIDPALPVHRARSLEIPRPDKLRAKTSKITHDPKPEKEHKGFDMRGKIISVLGKFLRNYVLIPDHRIGWIPFAYSLGKKLCAQHEIDLIYSLGPPFSSHLVGLLLKKTTGLPWVTDFMDPWIDNPYYKPAKIKRILEEKLEVAVINSADKTIWCTERFYTRMKKKYNKKANRFAYLPIGFDPEDFGKNSLPKKDSKELTIVYTGTFYGHRSPATFLRALDMLLKQKPELRTHIRVKIAGAFKPGLPHPLNGLDLDGVVEILGFIPYRESLALMKQADVLLLIVGALDEIFVPGKLYEYLGSGNYILAIAPEGEAAEIVRASGVGEVIDLNDIEGISGAIQRLYQMCKEDNLHFEPNASFIAEYHSKFLVEKTANLFNALARRLE